MPIYNYYLKKDSRDLRDFIYFSKTIKDHTALPKTVDLRDKMSPIVDQGQLGLCTANAIASGLREYLEIYSGQSLVRLSRLFLYYEERRLEGTVNQDAGASLRDGMKVLNQMGVCPETDDPYDISKFTVPPSRQALTNALNYRINNYRRILDLTSLQVSLSEGNPVVFGFNVYESLESDHAAQTGKIPMPKSGERLLGGHAVLAVGYVKTSAKRGYVIVRNSWGDNWGDQGYCYMSYSVFNKLVLDMWTGQ